MERRRFLCMAGFAVAVAGIPAFWKTPENEIVLYDVEGQTVFPVFDADGMIGDVQSFLVARRNDHLYSYGFDHRVTPESVAREQFQTLINRAFISGRFVAIPSTGERFEIAA